MGVRSMPYTEAEGKPQFAGMNQGSSGGGGSSYTLPTATASVLGGVKIGAGVSVTEDGTISVASSGFTLIHSAAFDSAFFKIPMSTIGNHKKLLVLFRSDRWVKQPFVTFYLDLGIYNALFKNTSIFVNGGSVVWASNNTATPINLEFHVNPSNEGTFEIHDGDSGNVVGQRCYVYALD